MRQAKLKITSDGSIHGTKVIAVDDEGNEHEIRGVRAVESSIGIERVPSATITADLLAAWPEKKKSTEAQQAATKAVGEANAILAKVTTDAQRAIDRAIR